MSRVLTSDVQHLILSYLPIMYMEKLLLNDSFSVPTLIEIARLRYSASMEIIKSKIHDSIGYLYLASCYGDIGHLGHWATSDFHCCLLAIQKGDFELLKHYLYLCKIIDLNAILLLELACRRYQSNPSLENKKIVYYLYLLPSFEDNFSYVEDIISQLRNNINNINMLLCRPTIIISDVFTEIFCGLEIDKLNKIKIFEDFPNIHYLHPFKYFIAKADLLRCTIMCDWVQQHFPPSPERNSYLTILNMISNNDFNLHEIISISLREQAITIAASTCIDRVDLIAGYVNVGFLIPSEVIYSIKSCNKISRISIVLNESILISGNSQILLDHKYGSDFEYYNLTIQNNGIGNADIAIHLRKKNPHRDFDAQLKPHSYAEYMKMKAAGFQLKLPLSLLSVDNWYNKIEKIFKLIYN